MKQPRKLCDFSCKYAEFTQDAYCSDNITIYCKKLKKLVRKFSPCSLDKKTKTRKKSK